MADSFKKYPFEKSVIINAPVDEIFQFHLNTNNLPKISPPFPKASIKSISDIPLKEGSTVTVELNMLIFKNEWEILIEKLIDNKLIVDLQKRGLFEYWRHSHIFEPFEGSTKMIDKIEFIPPFGFVGKLMIPVIRLQLNTMFKHRHKQTKKIFEK